MNLAYLNQEQQAPIDLFWKTQWDFFTGGSGAKTGYTTQLKRNGCVLNTSETIEFRRWIRMMIRDERSNVFFTAVGRVLRCENLIEASLGSEITLYRYTVEFTYPLDTAVLLRPQAEEQLAS